ncbi:MAG TPA: carboxypeptidase-like regulatory domain-containing protein [Chthoniobacter sp.]|jgi:hypothetical protein
MKIRPLRATLLLLSCALTGCTTLTTRFDEAAFAPIRSSGSAVIAGRAVGYMGDRHWAPMQTRVAQHLTVGLMPANAYTDDVARTIWRNAPTEVVLDPRLTQFVRRTTSDGDGNFSFGHVAPGSYYVFCRFTWPSRDNVLNVFDDYVTRDYLNEQTLFAKVTVTGSESVRIGAWQLSSYTGTPVDNPPSLQETRIF